MSTYNKIGPENKIKQKQQQQQQNKSCVIGKLHSKQWFFKAFWCSASDFGLEFLN